MNTNISIRYVVTDNILLDVVNTDGTPALEMNSLGNYFKVLARAVTLTEPFKLLKLESKPILLENLPSQYKGIVNELGRLAEENIDEKGTPFDAIPCKIKL